MNTRWTMWAVAGVLTASAAWAQAPAGSFTVDSVHTTAMFRIKHLGVSYAYGRFNDVTGTVSLDGADPSKHSVAISIKTESVDTANEGRDKHLRTADFFDVEKFPEMSFTSTSFKKVDNDTFEVTGDFTMHGVTKPLTVVVDHTGSGKNNKQQEIVGFETAFEIKRSEFEMGKMVPFIGDEVKVTLSVEAIKQP